MKLLTKANIYFSSTALLVLILSGIIVFFMLQYIIRDEIDERLLDQKNKLTRAIQRGNNPISLFAVMDSSIQISLPVNPEVDTATVLADTSFFNDLEREIIPYRLIRFPVKLNGELRFVTIFQSLIDREELIEAIFYSFFVVLIIMISSIIIADILGMRHLWKPFRQILNQIRLFDFHKNKSFDMVETNISEFKELNKELNWMTDKLTADYFAIKEFSENASHEMQTPLAIILSKLELLLQRKDFNEESIQALMSAHKAAVRLSRLHNNLNLLSRIENKEFTEMQSVSFETLINDQVENINDLIILKNLTLESNLNGNPLITGNVFLLEIMLSNLLMNAIKHNIKGGNIRINLSDIEFSISNTGNAPEFPPEKMFERFRKGKSSSDSTGLGSAIVQQICILHRFKISYTFHDEQHFFNISF